MTRGVSFTEVREALDRARSWRVEMLAEGMGLDPEEAVVQVGLRAWTSYVEAAMLTWLERGSPERDDMVEMLIRALGATAEGIEAARS